MFVTPRTIRHQINNHLKYTGIDEPMKGANFLWVMGRACEIGNRRRIGIYYGASVETGEEGVLMVTPYITMVLY